MNNKIFCPYCGEINTIFSDFYVCSNSKNEEWRKCKVCGTKARPQDFEEKLQSYLMNLPKLIHENAISHGWWDDNKRTYGEALALVNCEFSESLEEYRNGRPPIYFWSDSVCGTGIKIQQIETDLSKYTGKEKLEGMTTELGDGIIRIYDVSEQFKWGVRPLPELYSEIDNKDLMPSKKEWQRFTNTFGDFKIYLDWYVTSAYMASVVERKAPFFEMCIKCILLYCREQGWDIVNAILLKHEYNKSRPYKHGGKLI